MIVTYKLLVLTLFLMSNITQLAFDPIIKLIGSLYMNPSYLLQMVC